LLERWLEDPARLARLKRGGIGLLVVIAAVEGAAVFAPGEHHHHFAFEGWPAWGSAYGLVSCIAIIVLSKLIGKAWLMRRDDYYSRGEEREGEDA
jgi:hypothetical protein